MNLIGLLLFIPVCLGIFRPPATPLIVSDPYFSIWSFSDDLTADWSRHWSGAVTAMVGLVRIDDSPFRFMGPRDQAGGSLPPALKQIGLPIVEAHKSRYQFEGSGVHLDVIFYSDDRFYGVSDIEIIAHSVDQHSHRLSVYYDHTAELAVSNVLEPIVWSRGVIKPSRVLRMGTAAQKVLGQKGDFIRINWGFFYLLAPVEAQTRFSGALNSRSTFVSKGVLPPSDDMRQPRACMDDWPVSAVLFPEIVLASDASRITRNVILAYDDVNPVRYFETDLRPAWSAKYSSMEELLLAWELQRDTRLSELQAIDNAISSELRSVGGDKLADLGSLVYRQVKGALKWAIDPREGKGLRLYLKEISSNGDFQTVDVIFPAAPFFLKFEPMSLYWLLKPLMEFALNKTGHHEYDYNREYSPHDLGTFPIADIRGEGEPMPVEETANMLLMYAGIAQSVGKVDFMEQDEWKMLKQWADYLIRTALDPGSQLYA